ncbi:carbohydrate ABC transporter membrane protein 1, CUT1 family [Rathayibacter oskolensis]|uniref:Carbohydrate ABC transporter membrane protein 1, CUT1 family n=2 Tax=Rathayibacter oskolensis TaxID=1891671 RepID=A0A1X7PD10_9MICO|nr:sugar ABC transporter permease [Rathayibacter oskolensis]SMH49009.1 carbohydrate ABC transporter membrane protein 1, CUT1 family [Rathayibacter oskolensis]
MSGLVADLVPVDPGEADHGPKPVPPRNAMQKRQRRREALSAYAFLSPWLIGLVVIVLGPMIASLYLSFTRYDLIGTPEFIGLDNYERMLTADPRFLKTVGVTALYTAISVPGILVFSLLLAMFLNRGMRFLGIYRALFYLPSLLGGSVAIAVLWIQVFGSEGIVNAVLGLVGIDGPSWVGNPSTALITVIALSIWTFGSTMVIFLAGLRQIPDAYYEAAQLDGASRLQRFTTITLPHLTPVIFFNGLLTIVNALQSFTPAYVISGGTGQPADSLLLYTVYLYLRGFVDFQMGYASALAWALLLGLAAITAVLFWSTRYWVFYGEDS